MVDVNQLLEETLILVENKTTSHKVTFLLNLMPGLSLIKADAEQLKQVFLNLLINAMQAVAEKGWIEIMTGEEDSKFVYICIKDNGEGIPDEELPKVFDPFYTTKPNGTGLGLSVVHRIVGAHSGRIDIQSAVAKGTAVTIRLPVMHQGDGVNERI
jgi:two-component system sensor histidine kinase AtoS